MSENNECEETGTSSGGEGKFYLDYMVDDSESNESNSDKKKRERVIMIVRVMSVRKMVEVTCPVRVTIPRSLVVILKEQTILMPYGKGLSCFVYYVCSSVCMLLVKCLHDYFALFYL